MATLPAGVSAHIDDVCDPILLARMIEERYVRTQVHPHLPLTIYNYTQHAQFDRVWNDATRSCRGLIVDDAGRVVGRPFTKFFNYGEHNLEQLPKGVVQVTDKLDGSLGILYPTSSGYAIATRGSFVSDQARHATSLWSTRYADVFEPNPDWTYLFEIIYPENRIVVDYQGLDDLVLIGAVEIATGRSIPLDDARLGWPGRTVAEFAYTTLEEAVAAPERGGVEGIVVHFVDADLRVKIKHDEYVRLHRIVTGVSERRIWEALSEGEDLSDWLEAVPDEFYTFVTETRDRLLTQRLEITRAVHERYAEVVAGLPTGWVRRDFAAAVTAMGWPLARALFLVLDGKEFDHLVWAQIRPTEHRPIFTQGEDSN